MRYGHNFKHFDRDFREDFDTERWFPKILADYGAWRILTKIHINTVVPYLHRKETTSVG